MDLYDWVNKIYCCSMATVVGIVDECGLSIDTHHGNYPNKSKPVL